MVVKNDLQRKTITFGNKKIHLALDYNGKANISSMEVNGQKVIGGTDGIYSAVRTSSTTYSSLHTTGSPTVATTANTVKVSGISYGDKDITINENWKFTITGADVKLDIDRSFSKPTW